MNCFVLRVDGVLCVGPCCLLSVTVLGQVGGAPGPRGRHRAVSAGRVATVAALLAHAYVARRWVVLSSPHAHRASIFQAVPENAS